MIVSKLNTPIGSQNSGGVEEVCSAQSLSLDVF
jgi:hypothetical protein